MINFKPIPSAASSSPAVLRADYRKKMEAMFEAVSDLYAEYWHDFLHFAIFQDPQEDREDAFLRTHEQFVRALKIDEAKKIIELACGRGGFSDFMARHTSGTVLGVDISPAQLRHARRFERGNLRFQQQDIMRLEDLGETFDAVSFIDAGCYLPDKKRGVKQIAAVTRPCGRLLLVDWCKAEELNSLQEELVLLPFMHYWAIPSLETASHYRELLQQNGFEILEQEDLNSAVAPNWEFAYQQALNAARATSAAKAAKILLRAGLRVRENARIIKEQFPAALYIKAGFDAGFLRYTYFLARKSPELSDTTTAVCHL